jgi:hypothetical protein
MSYFTSVHNLSIEFSCSIQVYFHQISFTSNKAYTFTSSIIQFLNLFISKK